MGLEVTGLEDMIAELQRLADPKVAIEATKRAVRAGAEVVFERVLANVPVREFEATEETTGLAKGAMKASLDVFDDSYADGSVSSTVAFGKDAKHAARLVEEGHRKVHGGKSKLGKDGLYHGEGIETGFVPAHPFFRPAVEGSEQEVSEAVDAAFRKEIEAATKI